MTLNDSSAPTDTTLSLINANGNSNSVNVKFTTDAVTSYIGASSSSNLYNGRGSNNLYIWNSTQSDIVFGTWNV
jgi:hypothetical protein